MCRDAQHSHFYAVPFTRLLKRCTVRHGIHRRENYQRQTIPLPAVLLPRGPQSANQNHLSGTCRWWVRRPGLLRRIGGLFEANRTPRRGLPDEETMLRQFNEKIERERQERDKALANLHTLYGLRMSAETAAPPSPAQENGPSTEGPADVILRRQHQGEHPGGLGGVARILRSAIHPKVVIIDLEEERLAADLEAPEVVLPCTGRYQH